jgi:hypothetical protein
MPSPRPLCFLGVLREQVSLLLLNRKIAAGVFILTSARLRPHDLMIFAVLRAGTGWLLSHCCTRQELFLHWQAPACRQVCFEVRRGI